MGGSPLTCVMTRRADSRSGGLWQACVVRILFAYLIRSFDSRYFRNFLQMVSILSESLDMQTII